MGNGYEAFQDVAPSGDDLATLTKLADQLFEKENEVAEAETALKKLKQEQADLAERQIPETMDRVGMAEFTTRSGLQITVNKKVRASIPDAHEEEAFAWLDAHGHGGLIKSTVTLAFAKGQEKMAEKIRALLAKAAPMNPAKSERWVENPTLCSFIKGQLEDGKDIPMKLFGAFEQKIAKVKTKKG